MEKLHFKSIITNIISSIEEDWLLNISIQEEIQKYYPEYLPLYKKYSCREEFRKFAITRDIYKYLLFDKIEYRIKTELDKIVFELLTNPNLQIIKRLLKGTSRHRRLIANLMSFIINRQINDILKLVNYQNEIKEKEKNNKKEKENGKKEKENGKGEEDDTKGNEDGRGEEDDTKEKKNGNSKGEENNTKEEDGRGEEDDTKGKKDGRGEEDATKGNEDDKDENELKNNINILIKKELKKIEDKIKEIKTITEQSVGKHSNIFKTKTSIKKNLIKLDKNTLEKIKNQGKSIYNFYHSQENIQHLTNFPSSPDYAILENTLFFSKILNKEFTKLDKRSVIAVDLYVDVSDSMEEYNKREYARTMVWELKRIGVKFRNVYIFDNDIKEIKLEEIFINKFMGGGTNLNKVLENIKKRNKNCLIISDLQDELYPENLQILQKYKSKISVILLGDTNEYYLHSWKKTTGIALWFKIKK